VGHSSNGWHSMHGSFPLLRIEKAASARFSRPIGQKRFSRFSARLSRRDGNSWVSQPIAESRPGLDDAMRLLVVAQFSP
jgi:hypothetical protein